MTDAFPRLLLGHAATAPGASGPTTALAPGGAPGPRVWARENAGSLPHPLRPARSPAPRRTGTIALVGPPLSDPYWAAAVAGATRQALGLGLAALVVEEVGDGSSPGAPQAAVGPGTVDGVVVGPGAAGAVETLGLGRLPAVVLDGAGRPGRAAVSVDAAGAARGAVDFLAGLGHRRLGLVEAAAGPDSDGRDAAFAGRCRALGLPEPTVTRQRGDEQGGARGLAALRSARAMPTAVFTSSFAQAAGMLDAAAGLGLDVPGELSVLAGGDCPAADRLVPALSTLAAPSAVLGAAAVAALVALLSGADPRTAVPAPALLLTVRSSTGRCPADR
ncbi:LacI family DNA-binding transcriptional regulator [Kitasatospora cineracea]|uniref:LacI family transcriptional regulator n=1 Tax=Kitasatospora cineracea TaxID=88074 RepID=A0A8G1ULT1_9ACTN|nr:LacI family DNA-binding transcriptional regulator [Kitasatospora cineracea]ROR46420.1 LacI family transcriptional regulator [Kitasatospora cineracea]